MLPKAAGVATIAVKSGILWMNRLTALERSCHACRTLSLVH
uniref:Uncharacterized protein n=1 Tax=uncultured bacterium 5G4 TaxID=1701326 RepID=A0A166H3H0_9BACT|nr:hypothetical protein 5G4_028 [uncultured bacterium 5G4]